MQLPPRFVCRLWTMVGRPALEYGSEVCAQFLPRDLESYQRWTARRALGAPRNALGVAAVGDLGWPSLRIRHEHAMLRFWGRILDMPQDRLPRCVYEALREENHRSSWTSKVRSTARAWGLYEVWENQRLPPVDPRSHISAGEAWKEMLRGLAKRMARAEWQDGAHDGCGAWSCRDRPSFDRGWCRRRWPTGRGRTSSPLRRH